MCGLFDIFGEMPNQLKERLVGAEVFFSLVRRKFKGDHRDGKSDGLCKATGVILNQLGSARGTDNHRLWLEALVSRPAGVSKKLSCIGPEIAGLKRRIGHRRPMVPALDHREEEIGIGVALRRVQNVMQAGHAGGDSHGADMRRAFICPDRQFHSAAVRGAFGAPALLLRSTAKDGCALRSVRRLRGRANNSARSPACS